MRFQVRDATICLEETDQYVKYDCLGIIKTRPIRSITEACRRCDKGLPDEDALNRCRHSEQKESLARGFNHLICVNQIMGKL